MYNQYKQEEWERFNFNCCKRIVDKIEDDPLALYYFLKQISYNRELLAKLLCEMKEHTVHRLFLFTNDFGDKKFLAFLSHHFPLPEQNEL